MNLTTATDAKSVEVTDYRGAIGSIIEHAILTHGVVGEESVGREIECVAAINGECVDGSYRYIDEVTEGVSFAFAHVRASHSAQYKGGNEQ